VGDSADEVLSWATKFFADALMRQEAVHTNGLGGASPVSVLASRLWLSRALQRPSPRPAAMSGW